MISEKATSRQKTGRVGEDAAVRRYAAEGYTVVARNIRFGRNELDLVLTDGQFLVFVEVKTRHGAYGSRSPYGRPADAVDKAKRSRTVEAARAYLRENPTTLQPRIDVAEVYMRRTPAGAEGYTDRVERVVIFRNAFGAR